MRYRVIGYEEASVRPLTCLRRMTLRTPSREDSNMADTGKILFYNAASGEGATALLDDAGNYSFVSSISGFGVWTHVTGL